MKRKHDGQGVEIAELSTNQAKEPAVTGNHRQYVPRTTTCEPAYLLIADPFEMASNNQANIRLLEYRGKGREDPYFRIISFPDGKPTEGICEYLKSQGVQWNKPKGTNSWNVIIKYPTRNQDRLHAERVFHKVADMILEEKGLAREPELERF